MQHDVKYISPSRIYVWNCYRNFKFLEKNAKLRSKFAADWSNNEFIRECRSSTVASWLVTLFLREQAFDKRATETLSTAHQGHYISLLQLFHYEFKMYYRSTYVHYGRI